MISIAIPTVLSLLIKEERPIPLDLIEKTCLKVCGIIPNVDSSDLFIAVKGILENPKNIVDAVTTARKYLPKNTSVTILEIEEAIDKIITTSDYAGLSRNLINRYIQENYNIQMDSFRIIEANDPSRRRPWINEVKANIKWNFWNRYRDYLGGEKNFSDIVLNQLDRLTDRTLDGLFNPTENFVLSKYGLVVGQVQSGKTSNYTGLICKAADAGYKLIIVLAGIHNNLRSQTQLRLDEGFLGFDTQHQRAFEQDGIKIGVGKFSQNSIAHSLTSSLNNGDFSAGAANSLGINFNTNETIVAVVKKQKNVLPRLLAWLTANADTLTDGKKAIVSKSLLLIDDEADNASINTNPEKDGTTKINQCIKDILRLFHKSGYVGYTATPFANIFIPIEEYELFPRDFIINIPAPSNYIGPDKVFGTNLLENEDESDIVLPIVNRIDDYTTLIPNRHKKDDTLPDAIPESLRAAIKCFIITCAVRRLRGQTTNHNSMLVHVSRYINWQRAIKELVENNFDFYRRGIEMKIPSVLVELRKVFEEDHEYSYEYQSEIFTETYKSFKTVSQTILNTNSDIDSQVQVHEWANVLLHLHEAATRIQVKEINGGSGDALNYYDNPNGISVIAIGGDKLSRGLTLEGLSVSYYLRASRMYDTLMQMGRWFGYRQGYVDLCRLFTSRELNEWFCHITLASEELRTEFDYMADVAGSTPEQYALRVRSHPGVLQISASNKIRRAVYVDISWSGRLVETYQLKKDKDSVDINLNTTIQFIKSIQTAPTPEYSQSSYVWKENVGVELVKMFLRNFRVPESLKKVNPNFIIDFISVCQKNGELQNWSVALMSKKDAKVNYEGIAGFNIGCYERSDAKERQDSLTYFIKKNHIISPKDEFIDLSNEIKNAALQRTIEFHKKNDETYKNDFPSGEIVRREFRNANNPLLLIYFLDPKGAFGENSNSEPIVGFAISFPKSNSNPTVKFAINKQLLSLFESDDEIENENNDDED